MAQQMPGNAADAAVVGMCAGAAEAGCRPGAACLEGVTCAAPVWPSSSSSPAAGEYAPGLLSASGRAAGATCGGAVEATPEAGDQLCTWVRFEPGAEKTTAVFHVVGSSATGADSDSDGAWGGSCGAYSSGRLPVVQGTQRSLLRSACGEPLTPALTCDPKVTARLEVIASQVAFAFGCGILRAVMAAAAASVKRRNRP